MHTSLVISIPHQNGTLVTVDEPAVIHHNHPKFTLYISMDLEKCIMIQIYHYGTIQRIFTVLKILCVPPIHPSPHPPTPQPLATTGLFTLSIVLPFPECHVVGIIQYVAFLDFLPLSNMPLKFNLIDHFSLIDNFFFVFSA